MGLTVTASDVTEIGDKVWLAAIAPHQVRMFGEPRQAEGARSVLLVSGGAFRKETGTLSFDTDDAMALNVGTQAIAIVISADWGQASEVSAASAQQAYGPGDREFLRLAGELPKEMQQAAKELLNGVRSRWPGDLKRGLQRNFSNTPDNFWYVIVQPRAAALSITVRGEPPHFRGLAELELKVDRPGYSRFKVSSPQDVPSALKIIGASRRKA